MTTLSSILNKTLGPETKESSVTVSRETTGKPKFFIISTYGELLDLAIHLDKVEGYEVILCTPDKEYADIGKGIVKKDENWYNYLGKDYIFIVDGTENADLCDWFTDIGEVVVGTNKKMADHEDDRQLGQVWFKKAGFDQPESKNFTDFDSAIDFVKQNKEKTWILKQNAGAPKSLNHKGKFKGSVDMLFHLEDLKKSWNEPEYGQITFDLMEVVEGLELAASAFFDGNDFLRNSSGKIEGFLNFEFKKHMNGDLGPTTGEMGTLFLGVDEDNELFKKIMLHPEIAKKLRNTSYKGVFDINCIKTDKGITALEATSRFGIPATSYEFGEGMKSNVGKLIEGMAYGQSEPIEVNKKWGIAQVIVAPPFPVESDIEGSATSIGEKLWILRDGQPIEDFSREQLKHIHLENFKKDKRGYSVATKGGYMLVLTGTGDSIKETREKLLEYTKDNIFITDMAYRTDLGVRIEKHEKELS